MTERKRYRKRPGAFVIAILLNLDTDGFTYRKWGGEQSCRAGDWLVDNNGDTYTVRHDTFAATYVQESPGIYRKESIVWAEVAKCAGEIATVEGITQYEAGDYIVFNNEDGTDGYAVATEKFDEMYEPVD